MAEHMLFWRAGSMTKFAKRPPAYLMPNEFQETKRPPPMISWICIEPLRNQIIRHASHTRDFDSIWIDCMAYAVVEIDDISTILTGVEPGPGFLGAWNLFDAISQSPCSDTFQQSKCQWTQGNSFPELSALDSAGLLPVYRMQLPDEPETSYGKAPRLGYWEPVSLADLLASPELARKLYYHLELYKSHCSWKLDPSFFQKHPALRWPGYEKFTAPGRGFRLTPHSISMPIRQTREEVLSQFQQALFEMHPLRVL
ncbi:hypothetical protein FOPE_00164 [Fonsecaea pedrosoi]|nr:hypothetical protein FOPE_00164 [Fonsecaea pedrosoi]